MEDLAADALRHLCPRKPGCFASFALVVWTQEVWAWRCTTRLYRRLLSVPCFPPLTFPHFIPGPLCAFSLLVRSVWAKTRPTELNLGVQRQRARQGLGPGQGESAWGTGVASALGKVLDATCKSRPQALQFRSWVLGSSVGSTPSGARAQGGAGVAPLLRS